MKHVSRVGLLPGNVLEETEWGREKRGDSDPVHDPNKTAIHPGVEFKANLKSISHRCHLEKVALRWR